VDTAQDEELDQVVQVVDHEARVGPVAGFRAIMAAP
jgi:hypothetical protein